MYFSSPAGLYFTNPDGIFFTISAGLFSPVQLVFTSLIQLVYSLLVQMVYTSILVLYSPCLSDFLSFLGLNDTQLVYSPAVLTHMVRTCVSTLCAFVHNLMELASLDLGQSRAVHIHLIYLSQNQCVCLSLCVEMKAKCSCLPSESCEWGPNTPPHHHPLHLPESYRGLVSCWCLLMSLLPLVQKPSQRCCSWEELRCHTGEYSAAFLTQMA